MLIFFIKYFKAFWKKIRFAELWNIVVYTSGIDIFERIFWISLVVIATFIFHC